ncbi:hypothetical protein NDGK_02372 [Clostridiales bacterium CHKCI001]|nr:hypothetical protein NDGK_02372 [Clostridiales bacterium CHKCI001]
MPKDFDLLDMDYVNTASTTDCTGLIPAAPTSKAEMEAYEELYPYLPTAAAKIKTKKHSKRKAMNKEKVE